MRTLIIVGSSRSDGNTMLVSRKLQEMLNCDLLDLKTKNIGYYDYNYTNKDDDFIPLIKDIVYKYDQLIMATPVYWYSMSAIMKTFFDRLSDCIRIEKETGRKFREMYLAVISCSNDKSEHPYLFEPFKKSAEYLGMGYLGDVHTWVEKDRIPEQAIQNLKELKEKMQ